MKISKKCEYALRAVFELASRNSSQPLKIHLIAAAQNMPARFLEIILNELRHAGFVESRRGNEGGYMLVRSAEEMNVSEIIECIEGPLSLTADNANGNGRGGAYFGDCAFDKLWANVNDAISQVCSKTTFAQLIEYEKSNGSSFVPNYTI